nr:M15 family metallopeptidase [Cellulomonas sp. JH27-2]
MPTARRPHAPGQPDTPAAGQGVAPRPVTPPAGVFHAVAPQTVAPQAAAPGAAAPQGAARAWTASRVDAGTGPVAPLADAATTAIPRTPAPLPTVATATVPEQSGSAATPTPSSTTSAPAPSAPAPGAPAPGVPVPSAVSQDRSHGQPAASAPDAGAVRATSRRQSTGRTGSSRPEPGRRRRPARAATRLGVLAALAGVTVVIPVSQGAIAGTEVLSGAPLDKATLPSTVSALAAAPASILPPASLVPGEGAIAARAAADAASRSESRSLLPGCDPRERSAGSNGLLPAKDLCTLWDGHTRLRADAAASLAEFNAAYVARFGADMCLASGYRTLAEQRSVKASRGSLAAPPGKSNHGWGLAVDFCSQLTSGERWAWLNANAKAFGWENPAWALPGGSGPHERWHWEYTKGVKADGEYYGS